MNRRTRWMCPFIVAASLAAPAVLRAHPAPRELPTPVNQQRDQRDNQNRGRFYDQANRDWHDWNENEDRAYRQFLAENRREYREFARLDDREQAEYWRWRHAHPDRDDRGQGVPGRYYDNNGRDWHEWNENEERAYRFFIIDNHQAYISFDRAEPGFQVQYWVWRHSHPDTVILRAGWYYDADRRDWRQWNENEDRAYRAFLAENRREYREFARLNDREQAEYWNWRLSHPDRDDRGDRGRGDDRDRGGGGQGRRYYDQNTGTWHD
jgi:hypothetical protein